MSCRFGVALGAALLVLSMTARGAEEEHPTLAIGSAAPDF